MNTIFYDFASRSKLNCVCVMMYRLLNGNVTYSVKMQ